MRPCNRYKRFISAITINILSLLYLLPCFTILIIYVDLSAALSPDGFLSIDCGSSQTTNYTDALGIEWAPDGAIWPEISGWSRTSTGTPPVGDTTGGDKYKTLRYFPSADASTLKQSKFCYTLPATGNAYYLVRATFWYGTSATTTLYSTRISGFISFQVMVDTYTGAWIDIVLPQIAPLTEEMYIRTLSGSSSVSVCFSAASEDSDAPFVSALELRPLPSKMTSVAMINDTNTALRTATRDDFGASPDAPSIIRYPDDTLDRLWSTSTYGSANRTNETVAVGVDEVPPVSVIQTSFVASSAAGFQYNLSTFPASAPYMYYVALFFAELDPRVNAPGLRVFNVTINEVSFYRNLDIYNESGGLYRIFEIYSPRPRGPYSGYVLIKATSVDPTSVFPPSIAAAEILQLFDNPMLPATSSADISGIRGITSAMSYQLGRFTGDPCLPVGYKYPWINCTTANGNAPPRVVSISLSNWNLVGNVPPSINNLDQVVQISLDGNGLEGPLPFDLSNLLNLQVLNLSNNKLNGSIPDSLGRLPRLTYLDVRNNNFSGVIPVSIQQNPRLTFKYDGNPLLGCLPNNKTCTLDIIPPSPSPSSSRSNLPMIIGLVVGAVVICVAISIVVTCIICNRRKQNPTSTSKNEAAAQAENDEKPWTQHHAISASLPNAVPPVLSHTRVVEAANVSHAFTLQEIIQATHNFSTILGRGGFGIVYKGTLNNGTTVAVKVLSDASQQGTQQFLTEVTILSRVHHKNLVGLLGYCTEEKLILVYEYMSNGSLYDRLFSKGTSSLVETHLSWTQRLQILLDAAQGLAYLHGSCNPRIVHMDVKSSNILLSKTMEGKMSDFGISRQNSVDDGVQVTSKLIASRGYVDPEFASTLILSEKVDVYSFGVVLLEVMCGQPPFVRDLENLSDPIHIVEWASHYYQRGDVESILFHGVGTYNSSSVWKVAEIAMACTQFQGGKRPTMDEVCNELSQALRLETSYHTTYASTDTEDQFPFGEVRSR